MTRRVVTQLLELDPEAEVLILDNAAPRPYENAWIRLEENVFWTGALDFAIQKSRKEGFTHLWFLNNDLYFTGAGPYISRVQATLKRLEQMSKTTGPTGVYSPAIEKNPYHPQMRPLFKASLHLVRIIDAVAPVFNLTCLEEIGGLDAEDNPLGYGVDVWICSRALEAGWNLVVDSSLSLRHLHHSSAGRIPNFLEQAAALEENYLRTRLGDNFRHKISEQKKIVEELKIS